MKTPLKFIREDKYFEETKESPNNIKRSTQTSQK